VSLKKVTLLLAIIFLLSGIAEVFNHFLGNSHFLFKDYPFAIAGFLINGLMYLVGYINFSKFQTAKVILILAGVFSICVGVVFGTYNAYVGFGNTYDAFPMLVPILLINIGLFLWYIRAVVKHEQSAL
jgi:hypothetical protein